VAEKTAHGRGPYYADEGCGLGSGPAVDPALEWAARKQHCSTQSRENEPVEVASCVLHIVI
jgi:hypothetical protein